MKLVDASVLIYAVNADARNHDAARRWLDAALSGGAPVGFCWAVLLAFVRITTRPGIFPRPLELDTAHRIIRSWLDQPAAQMVAPTERHLDLVARHLTDLGVGGNLVNDAHLAALAVEHRGEVITFDRDFGRFEGVAWSVPK